MITYILTYLKKIFAYGKCLMCKRTRFFVRKREIQLKQLNRTATSKEGICRGCYKGILQAQELGILQ